MILNWWFDVHDKKRNQQEGELPSLVNGLERERAFLDDGPVLAALCAPPAPA